MRRSFLAPLLLLVAPSLAACGSGAGREDGAYAPTDAGTCTGGSYPIACAGVVLYCCAPGAHCASPSCGSPDAGGAPPPADAGSCGPDQYLVIPCCGGENDTACSNGPGPPPPFCSALPSACEGQTSCTLGGCEGALDGSARTLQCFCI